MSEAIPQLTPDEHLRHGAMVAARLSELLDGFAVVGFHPITQEPLIICNADDSKTRLALNSLLLTAISQPPMQRTQ